MDVPPVEEFRLLQLPVLERRNFGDWLNVEWDDHAAVAVAGATPYMDVDHERRGDWRLLRVDALSVIGHGITNGVAAIDDASANSCIVRGAGQPPVRYGDLTRKGSVELPVDGPHASVKWDFMLPCDLSNAKGVEFDFRCDDVSGLSGVMFYFKSGNGWYTRNLLLEEEGKWRHFRMLKSGCGKEGEPGGWDAVKSLRINIFRNGERKATTAAVADFSIIPASESAAKVEADRARVDAEAREFVKSVPERLARDASSGATAHGAFMDATGTARFVS